MPVSSSSPVARSSTAALARVDRVVQRCARRDRRAQRLDRGPARDLTAAVTAHAVGDREQRVLVVDEEGVLVVRRGAGPVSVADAAASFTGRPRAPSRRPAPCRPCATACGSVMRLPFTSVPLRGADVLDPERAVPVEGARVHLRDEGVERERDRATAAATDRGLAVDGIRRGRASVSGDDHDQAPFLALRGALRARGAGARPPASVAAAAIGAACRGARA